MVTATHRSDTHTDTLRQDTQDKALRQPTPSTPPRAAPLPGALPPPPPLRPYLGLLPLREDALSPRCL